MKKLMIGVSLIVILSSCLSLQADVQRVKLNVLGKYLDLTKLLGKGTKTVFLGGTLNNKTIIEMVVDSIKVGELPIDVAGDRQATVQDYFDTAMAKEFIRNVLTQLANKSLTAENFGEYLVRLEVGIFKGKKGVPHNVGEAEAENTVEFLKNLKGYFSTGLYTSVGFFDFVELQGGMPQFLKTLIAGYFDLPGARSLIENPRMVSVDKVFKYINFEPFFRDKPNKHDLSEGLKLSVLDFITFIGKPEKNAKDFMSLLKTLM